MSEVGRVTAILDGDIGPLRSALNQAKQESAYAVSSIEGKTSSIAGGMASAGKAVGAVLLTASATGGAALVGVGASGVRSFMDIESAAANAASKMDLSAIATSTGQTTEQAFNSVKEHVMSLADELGQLNTNAYDPSQIAGALAGMAAGGFDVASASAEDMQDVLALATATDYDLSASASLAMSTLNQFGMGISDLGRVSDVYAVAAGKSAAGMSDFDYAMQQAGPVAKGVGMSFEELTARISKLADAGYGGEKSGTALRTAMMALTSPTKTQAETLDKLGITYDDIDPRVHTFSETLDLLISKGADIYDFGEIFGKEGAAIVYSSATGNKAVKELTASLETADGAARDMAKNMLSGLKGSLDAAMGAASSLAYKIGGELEPALKSSLDWFSSTGAPAIRKFIDAISDADWDTVGSMIGDGLRAGFEKLKDIGSTVAGWIDEIDWSAVATTITNAISTGWGALKNLGSDLAGWIKDYDWGTLAGSIGDLIKSGWANLTGWASGVVSGFLEDWNAWIGSNGPSSLGESLAKAIANGAINLGQWIYSSLSDWWKSNGSSLGGVISASIDFVRSALTAAYDFSVSFAETLLIAGKGTIGASLLTVIGDAMNSAWDGAGDSLISKAAEWADTFDAEFSDIVPDQPDVDFHAKITGDDPRNLYDIEIPVSFSIAHSGDWYYLSEKTLEGKVPHGVYDSYAEAARAAKELSIANQEATTSTEVLDTALTDLLSTTSKFSSSDVLEMGIFETSVYLDTTEAEAAAARLQEKAAQEATKTVTINEVAAEKEVEEIDKAAKDPAIKPLDVDESEAKNGINKVDTAAVASKTKRVYVDTRQALSAIWELDRAASRPITKRIYVDIDADLGDIGGSILGGDIWDLYGWNSFANEGYVKSPTLAVVGDRPGGEYVIGADRFESVAAGIRAGGGGKGVNVTIYQSITGVGLSADELSRVLSKNNEEIYREVADKIQTGKAF